MVLNHISNFQVCLRLKYRSWKDSKEKKMGTETDESPWASQVSEGIPGHQEESFKLFLEKQGVSWEGQLDLKWQQKLTTTDRTSGHQ